MNPLVQSVTGDLPSSLYSKHPFQSQEIVSTQVCASLLLQVFPATSPCLLTISWLWNVPLFWINLSHNPQARYWGTLCTRYDVSFVFSGVEQLDWSYYADPPKIKAVTVPTEGGLARASNPKILAPPSYSSLPDAQFSGGTRALRR